MIITMDCPALIHLGGRSVLYEPEPLELRIAHFELECSFQPERGRVSYVLIVRQRGDFDPVRNRPTGRYWATSVPIFQETLEQQRDPLAYVVMRLREAEQKLLGFYTQAFASG